MINLAFIDKLKINKFKRWLIKTNNLSYLKKDFNFLFYLFFILKPLNLTDPFNFESLKAFYLKNIKEWNLLFSSFFVDKDVNHELNTNYQEFIFNLYENKELSQINNYLSFIQSKNFFYINYYNLFKEIYKNIELATFNKFFVTFLLNYALFFKHYLELKNNDLANKISLRLYFENIYTYNMQLIFQQNFNDFYIIANKLLPCHF